MQTSHIYIARSAIGAAMFVVVLIIVHLITSRISDTVLDSRVGAIDRILGFAFGVARGFVLVVIPFMFCDCVVSSRRISTRNAAVPWVRDASLRP